MDVAEAMSAEEQEMTRTDVMTTLEGPVVFSAKSVRLEWRGRVTPGEGPGTFRTCSPSIYTEPVPRHATR